MSETRLTSWSSPSVGRAHINHNSTMRTSQVVQWLKFFVRIAGSRGSVCGQGAISHTPQQRWKVLHAATKTQHSQVNQ